MDISKEDKEKLRKLAKLNNTNMNAFVRKLISNQLELMENQMMIYRAEQTEKE